MATTFAETYLLSTSGTQSVTTNNQTIIPNLALTGMQQVALTIRGVVFTAASGGSTAVGGATIIVFERGGYAIAQGTTITSGSQEGTFTIVFDGSLNLDYTLVVSAPGFAPVTDTIVFTNNTSVLDIILLNNDTSIPVIYGSVADAMTGEGIVGANVNIIGEDGNVVNVTTSANGAFLAYDSFTSGVNYAVTASCLGYDTDAQLTQIVSGSIGQRVEFALNQSTSNLTTIAGRVVVAGSSPPVGIAQALVGLYSLGSTGVGNGRVVQTVLTDQFGGYTFTDVDPTVDYLIRAIKITTATT